MHTYFQVMSTCTNNSNTTWITISSIHYFIVNTHNTHRIAYIVNCDIVYVWASIVGKQTVVLIIWQINHIMRREKEKKNQVEFNWLNLICATLFGLNINSYFNLFGIFSPKYAITTETHSDFFPFFVAWHYFFSKFENSNWFKKNVIAIIKNGIHFYNSLLIDRCSVYTIVYNKSHKNMREYAFFLLCFVFYFCT